MPKTVKIFTKSLALISITAVVGCASSNPESGADSSWSNYVPGFIKPYRQDIQQGNIVTQEEVDRLKVGMSKDQVRFVLGTPLLNDPFHTDRWDYLFMLDRAGGEVTRSRYTVIFEQGALARHGGENIPATSGEIKQGDSRPKRQISPTEKETLENDEQMGGTEKAPVLN